MKLKKYLLATSCVLALGVASTAADAATRLVMKVSDAPAASGTTVIDPYLDWTGTGGINEGVAGATSLTNNGVDYKDSWVDTNWGDVTSVRVSMYTSAVEVAYMEFSAAGTTKEDFFSIANLTSSTWTDVATEQRNFFSIAGSPINDRHWYVNRNWGGCPNDRGWMMVLDGRANPSYACAFEDNRTDTGSTTRGFLYADAMTEQNFTSGSIGVADVFAVTVTTAPVPVPASGALLAGALGVLAWRKRKASA